VPSSRVARSLLFAATFLAGCAGGDPWGDGPVDFSGPPQETLTSVSGQLRVDVRWWPRQPHVGDGAAELAIGDATGAPVSGVSLSVLLWMPAHGHGTSVQPDVVESAPGVFVVAPLYLHMPGEWDLLMSMAGTVDDTATASLTVP
jgi:hypothetical protein